MWLAIYAPIQVVLPEQVQSLHPADKAVLFSVVMAAGAIASLLANPVVGALSDRTTSRRGRRHPWTVAGALVGAAGLAVLAAAPDIPVMVLGWCIAQVGLGGMLATLTSALPDRVPARQRGALGGLIGISQMLGTVAGRPDRHRAGDRHLRRLPDLRPAGDRGRAGVHPAHAGRAAAGRAQPRRAGLEGAAHAVGLAAAVTRTSAGPG